MARYPHTHVSGVGVAPRVPGGKIRALNSHIRNVMGALPETVRSVPPCALSLGKGCENCAIPLPGSGTCAGDVSGGTFVRARSRVGEHATTPNTERAITKDRGATIPAPIPLARPINLPIVCIWYPPVRGRFFVKAAEYLTKERDSDESVRRLRC